MDHIKIMLVDDEERFLATAQKLIARKGMDIKTANGGRAALDVLAAHDIHVVILDVKMPDMDGVATLKEIKRLHPLVEVIMLTGHATVDTAVEGLKSGAFDYLAKPIDLDELLAKVEGAYNRRQRLERKILMAQSRDYVRSPREIIRERGRTDGREEGEL